MFVMTPLARVDANVYLSFATAAAVLVMARRASNSPVVHQHDTQVPRDEFKKFGRLALDGLIKQVLSGHERLSQKRGGGKIRMSSIQALFLFRSRGKRLKDETVTA